MSNSGPTCFLHNSLALYSLLEMDKRYAIVQRNEWKKQCNCSIYGVSLCSRRLISALQSSLVKGTLVTLGALRAFRVGQMDHEQVLLSYFCVKGISRESSSLH